MTTSRARGAAWAVHLYTATGVVLGFMALAAAGARDFRVAFLWLSATVVIDATDGWLARRARVAERLPSFNGARLDDIVDYQTYVVVPAYLLYQAAVLPASWAPGIAAAMLLSSAYGFAREDAKTADHFFTGFPSYWNIVAFYLYAAGLAPWINAAVILIGCALVFVRTTYVYPSRMPVLQSTTIGAACVWGAALVWMVLALPQRHPRLLVASLLFPAYYAGVSLILDARRRRPA